MADVMPYVLKADGVHWQMLLPYYMWQMLLTYYVVDSITTEVDVIASY